ncbi:tape measure domain-containing protein [Thermosporothrix hazakensis]|jgi:tape measure domain-containing protein|uniref:Tape measure domain-containing protein n=1 Tax=Thermosporothrix hazakensis TaxID=644383 RepID=A0A326TUE1_THEHA|nr:tape measure protein [Thermosporothrix hazakensis]PZW19686.1 tape measure domain-containing protein [Thermosporothrix hazakensis]GCE49202.1 hypothetical protein KTH_40710 [Thermosporothrix hazakensis]
MGILSGLIVKLSVDMSGLKSGVAQAKSQLSVVSSSAFSTGKALQSMEGSGNMSKAVTNVEAAKAHLVLIESQVRKAREQLQKLEHAANAGEAVSGVEEARAKLVSLEKQAQDAREKIKRLEDSNTGQKLAAEFHQASTAASSFSSRISSMSSHFKSQLEGMKVAAMGLGTALTGALSLGVGAAIGLGTAIFKSSGQMEQTEIAFKTLMGSASDAKKMLLQIEDFADSSPYDFPQLADTSQRLLAIGINAKDIIPILTDLGDAVAGLSLDKSQLSDLAGIFGQMMATGKATSEDLMQIADRKIPVWKYLSEQLHMSQEEARKLVSDGLLPAGKAIDLIRKGIQQSNLAGAMKAQGESAFGLLSTILDKAGKGLRLFGEGAFNSMKGGLQQLVSLLSSPAFMNFAQGAGKLLGDTLAGIGSFISTNVAPGFSRLVDLFGKAGEVLNKGGGWSNFVQSLQNLGNTIASNIAPHLTPLADGLKGLFSDANVKAGAGILNQAFQGLADGIKLIQPHVGTLWNALMLLGTFLTTTFKPVWDQLVATWKNQLLPALQGIWQGLQPLLPLLAGIGLGVVAFFIGSFSAGMSFLSTFIQGLISFIGGLVQYISGVFQLWSGLIMFFVHLFTGQFDQLGADLGNIWGGIVNMVSGAWSMIVGIYKMGVQSVISYVSGFISGVIGFFQWLFDVLVGHSIVPDLVNSIVSFFQNMGKWVSDTVSHFVSNIVGFFGNLYNQATGKASEIVSGIGSFFSGLPGQAWQWMSDFGANLIGGLGNLVGSVGQKAKEIADTIWSYLHFSTPEIGPLVSVRDWMPDFGDILVSGLDRQIGRVERASSRLATAMTPQIDYPEPAGAAVMQAVQVALQGDGRPIVLEVDGRVLGEISGNYIANRSRTKVGVR